MRIIAHCDQGGRPDGVQIMVHRGYAYIGHMFSKASASWTYATPSARAR
jgi:hypothetical protein